MKQRTSTLSSFPPSRMGLVKGDLVRVKPCDSEWTPNPGAAGLVLEFDVYHPDDSSLVIPIVKVLWPDSPGWIDISRLEKIARDEDEPEESFWKMWGHI